MDIQFGAQIKVKNPLRVNRAQAQEAMAQSVQIRNHPLLKHMERTTADEIEVIFDKQGRDANQAFVLSQKRVSKVLFPAMPIPDEEAERLVARLAAHVASHQKDIESRTGEDQPGRGLGSVAGMDDLKAQFRKKVLGPIQTPGRYQKYRRDIPNGVLLYGAPGCGKTYFAERLAEELRFPFLKLTPSGVGSKYIHETGKLIGEKFAEAEKLAKQHGKAVLFIDEIEAFTPDRTKLGGNANYKAEEVTELLQRLNKAGEKGIIVVAATNRPELMDAASLRSGRLDEHIYVPPPDLKAREASLAFHMQGRYQAPDLDYRAVAEKAEGFSQSDLEYLIVQAVDRALEEDQPVSTEHLLDALNVVPPSVPPEVEKGFQTIPTRGVDKNQLAHDARSSGGYKIPVGFQPPEETPRKLDREA